MKKAIVTGATGAIGMALVNLLVKKDVEVLVLAHKNSKRNLYLPKQKGVSIVECNVEEYDSLELCKDYDVFFNLMWANGRLRENVTAQIMNVNHEIMAVELAARCGCRKYIGTGSQAEFGIQNELLGINTIPKPVNAFGMTKLFAGEIGAYRAKQLGLDFFWTRVLSVYGPYDGEKTMVTSVIKQLLDGVCPIMTKCEQKWDYIYSDDAANALFLIASKGVPGKKYTIGSGTVNELKYYVEKIKEAIDPNAEIKYGMLPYTDNQVMFLGADIGELQKDTGFKPVVLFEDGIKKTVDWYKRYSVRLS